MENELTLRDKLAMSMGEGTLPTINDVPTMEIISKELGIIEWDDDDVITQMKWAFEYQSKIRYMYADAMLKAREE